MSITQAEVLDLFSQVSAIKGGDQLLMVKANGDGTVTATKITAELLRAYLYAGDAASEWYTISIDEEGYLCLGGVRTQTRITAFAEALREETTRATAAELANTGAISTEVSRAQAAEAVIQSGVTQNGTAIVALQDVIAQMLNAIDVLNGNDVEVVDDLGDVATPDTTKIYRVPNVDGVSGEVESYTDYMCVDATTTPPAWKEISTHAMPGIDTAPTKNSRKIVEGGGIFNAIQNEAIFDISVKNAIGGVPYKYADLAAALGVSGGNVPADYRHGGMNVRFVKEIVASTFHVEVSGNAHGVAVGDVQLPEASEITAGDYVEGQLGDFPGIGSLAVGSHKVFYVQNDYPTLTYTTWTVTKLTDGVSKYEQWRLMSDSWSANVSDWQGVDGEPTIDSQNMVLSGGVAVALSNKIGKIEIVSGEPTWEDVPVIGDPVNAYITINGNIKSASTYKVRKYAVEAGKKYSFKGVASTSHSVYFFYDSQDSAIANSGVTPEDNSLHDYEVTAPIGSAYIRVEGFNSTNVDMKVETPTYITKYNQDVLDSVGNVSDLETVEKNTVVGAVNELVGSISTAVTELTEAINGVDGKVDSLTETVVSPNMFDKDNDVLTKYYLSPTSAEGKLTSGVDNYKMSEPIKVIPGHYYYLFGRNNNSIKAIRCLAEGATLPSSKGIKVLAASAGVENSNNWYLPNDENTNTVSDGQFKVPLSADYVQFTLTINSGSSQVGNYDNVMLLHVGDTYNPNFVVPEYQPYDPTPKVYIKPDVLPCDIEPKENSENPITSGAVYEALNNIEPTPADSKQLKVLLIGSSHGVNTISMFPTIAKASGIDIVCGNLYSGSATIGNTPNSVSPDVQIPYKAKFNKAFERFAVYENGSWGLKTTKTLQYALTSYKWDAIIVQRGNSEVTKWDDSMDGYMQYLLDYIKDNCIIGGNYYTPKLYFNSGLANGSSYGSVTQVNTTNTIIETSEIMKSRWGIDIIPIAVALQYARKTVLHSVGAWNPTDGGMAPDLTYDGQHIDTGIGQYILGCCVFEKICGDFFNISVRELKYLPSYSDISGNTTNVTEAYFTPISDYYSRIGKTCATLACIDREYKAETVSYLNGKFGSEPKQYTITYNLTNCSLNDNRETIYNDDVYMATLTADSGYTIDISSIAVMMNNEDVTSDVYVHNTNNSIQGIRIGSITGNIVITASAS